MTTARAFRGFRFPAEVILWAVRWYRKRRCRMHGAFCGAPTGNRNALKHGRWSRELLELRRGVRELVRANAETIELA